MGGWGGVGGGGGAAGSESLGWSGLEARESKSLATSCGCTLEGPHEGMQVSHVL